MQTKPLLDAKLTWIIVSTQGTHRDWNKNILVTPPHPTLWPSFCALSPNYLSLWWVNLIKDIICIWWFLLLQRFMIESFQKRKLALIENVPYTRCCSIKLKKKNLCIEVSTCTAVQSISVQVDESHKLNSLWSTPRSRNRTRAAFEVPSRTCFRPPSLPLPRVAADPDSHPVDQLLPVSELYIMERTGCSGFFVSAFSFVQTVVCSCACFTVLTLALLYREM